MKILVVDDNELLLDVIRSFLESAGHSVSLAKNGQEALNYVVASRPDAIILDIFMPEMDGIETLRKVMTQCPQVHVLMISGGGGDCNFLEMARKLGAHDILQKPFTKAELLASLAH